jgi:hypothetical protein
VHVATRLGAPFKIYSGEISTFRVEVAKRIAALQVRPDSPQTILSLLRAQLRTEVARSGKSTSAGWWPRRLHTATPGPGIRICTPMWRVANKVHRVTTRRRPDLSRR